MAYNAYSIYAINIDTDSGVTQFLDQVTNQSHSFNQDLVKLVSDGAVDPTFSSVGKISAEVSFSTGKIATALSVGGLSGFVIDDGLGGNGVEFFMQQHQPGGTRKTGADHIKATMGNGIMVPMSLSAGSNDAAKIEFKCVGIYDGTNDPITYLLGQSLPANAVNADQLFYSGPVILNGVTFEAVQSLDLDFGVKLNQLGGDGLPYDTFVNIANREPVIKFKTFDVDKVLTVIGPNGVGHTQASTFYLRKAADGGTRVPDATAEHIKLSTTKGSFIAKEISGESGEILGFDVEVHPVYDGTNDVIVINTASAIA